MSKKTKGSADSETDIVKIERGGWEIDKNADDLTVQDFGNTVHVTANGQTYSLTRDEAAPFLENEGKAGIAQE